MDRVNLIKGTIVLADCCEYKLNGNCFAFRVAIKTGKLLPVAFKKWEQAEESRKNCNGLAVVPVDVNLNPIKR